MIIQYVKFKSELSFDDVMRVAKERLPLFEAMPGLIQKYYVHDQASGEVGGIYVWDSQESLDEFRQSDVAKSIAAEYQVKSAPRIESLEVVHLLREEELAD